MAKPPGILEHLRRIAIRKDGGLLTDAQLLECYLADRDDAAFEGLLRRHGPMVYGVCRRVLGNDHDAEDAVQAAFLVLVRKAASIEPLERVGNWLHGVAYTTAVRARSASAKRRAKEEKAAAMPATSDAQEDGWEQLLPLLDRELKALPDNFRLPIVLCDLEGKTRKQAAQQLGWAEGTVASRLTRGRDLLAKRMRRHGLPFSGAALAAALLQSQASAALPRALVVSTAKAASLFAGSSVGTAATISASVISLTQGVLRTMLLNKLAKMMVVLVVLGMTVYGTGLLGHTLMAQQGTAPLKKTASSAPAALPWRQVGPEKKTDAERIVGTWRIAKWRGDGEDAPPEFIALARFTFSKDGKISMRMVDEAKEGEYKLVGPGQIDLLLMDIMISNPGIYEFQGDDKLTVCLTVSGDLKRPIKFEGEKGTRQDIFVFSRVKPAEDKLSPEEMAKNTEMIDKIRNAATRSISANNLHNIGLTFHHYYDAFNSLPLHAIYSKDGKTPLLSWRVRMLPYLSHEALYKEFKLDEPWDSAHNKKLIAKMPAFYAITSAKTDPGMTYYQVFTGPETLFDGTKKVQWADIKDGLSSTIVVIEAKDPVIWTKPEDLTLPKDKDKMPAVGGQFKEGFHVLVYDGSVWMLRHDTPPAMLRALVTPNGGETVDLDKLKVKGN